MSNVSIAFAEAGTYYIGEIGVSLSHSQYERVVEQYDNLSNKDGIFTAIVDGEMIVAMKPFAGTEVYVAEGEQLGVKYEFGVIGFIGVVPEKLSTRCFDNYDTDGKVTNENIFACSTDNETSMKIGDVIVTYAGTFEEFYTRVDQ